MHLGNLQNDNINNISEWIVWNSRGPEILGEFHLILNPPLYISSMHLLCIVNIWLSEMWSSSRWQIWCCWTFLKVPIGAKIVTICWFLTGIICFFFVCPPTHYHRGTHWNTLEHTVTGWFLIREIENINGCHASTLDRVTSHYHEVTMSWGRTGYPPYWELKGYVLKPAQSQVRFLLIKLNTTNLQAPC